MTISSADRRAWSYDEEDPAAVQGEGGVNAASAPGQHPSKLNDSYHTASHSDNSSGNNNSNGPEQDTHQRKIAIDKSEGTISSSSSSSLKHDHSSINHVRGKKKGSSGTSTGTCSSNSNANHQHHHPSNGSDNVFSGSRSSSSSNSTHNNSNTSKLSNGNAGTHSSVGVTSGSATAAAATDGNRNRTSSPTSVADFSPNAVNIFNTKSKHSNNHHNHNHIESSAAMAASAAAASDATKPLVGDCTAGARVVTVKNRVYGKGNGAAGASWGGDGRSAECRGSDRSAPAQTSRGRPLKTLIQAKATAHGHRSSPFPTGVCGTLVGGGGGGGELGAREQMRGKSGEVCRGTSDASAAGLSTTKPPPGGRENNAAAAAAIAGGGGSSTAMMSAQALFRGNIPGLTTFGEWG